MFLCTSQFPAQTQILGAYFVIIIFLLSILLKSVTIVKDKILISGTTSWSVVMITMYIFIFLVLFVLLTTQEDCEAFEIL